MSAVAAMVSTSEHGCYGIGKHEYDHGCCNREPTAHEVERPRARCLPCAKCSSHHHHTTNAEQDGKYLRKQIERQVGQEDDPDSCDQGDDPETYGCQDDGPDARGTPQVGSADEDQSDSVRYDEDEQSTGDERGTADGRRVQPVDFLPLEFHVHD